MKNLFQLIILGLVAIFGFYSCDQTAERALYDETAAAGYSFQQKTISAEFASEDNGLYKIQVSRTNAAQAATVPLTLTETTGNFTLVSPSAAFNAGDFTSTVSIKYVLTNLNPATLYNITLKLPVDQRSFGSDSILTIQGRMRLSWSKYGSGVFLSEFFSDEEWRQDLYQCNEVASMYYLKDCYYKGYDLRFTLNADNSITYATQAMGYNHPTYLMTSWAMPAATATTQPFKEGKKFYFVPRFTVSAGSFGQFLEVFTLD